MDRLRTLAVVTWMSLAVGGPGCVSGVEVHSVRAPGADFEQYRTFAFELSSQPPRRFASSPRSAEVRDEVERAAARVLESRGYVLEAGGPADLVVRIEAGRRDRVEPLTTGAPLIGTGVAGQSLPSSQGAGQGGPPTVPGPAAAETMYHGELDREDADRVEGAFVIDAFDGETHRLVWHGSARAAVNPGPIDDQRLRRAVESVLASFPARG